MNKRFFFNRFLLVWGGRAWSLGYYPGGGTKAEWIIVFVKGEGEL